MIDATPVGVVGAGSMGANHVRVIARQLGREVQVFDVEPARAERVAASHPAVTPASSLDALLDACGAVIVATPPEIHRDVAENALRYGRRVLLEKPACVSRLECEALVETWGDKTAIYVGYVERWNPAFLTVCQMLAADEDVLSIELNRSGPLAAQVTAGVVLDLMVHDLDLAVAMCGAAQFANCTMNALDGSPLTGEDIAYASLVAGDTLVRLKASRLSHIRVRELRVTTSRREIVADLARHTVEATSLSEASFVAAEPLTLREATTVERPFVTAVASPLEAQLNAFLAAEPPAHLATLRDAMQVHSLIEQMQSHSLA